MHAAKKYEVTCLPDEGGAKFLRNVASCNSHMA
jgi:hypothetical protein